MSCLNPDASSQPVCLVGVSGAGLTEAQLHDYAQIAIRNQIAVIKGAEIPPPFGGKYRQIMVYVDPFKMLSRQLSPMDVVNAVNVSRASSCWRATSRSVHSITTFYSNSLVDTMKELDEVPLKTKNDLVVRVSLDIGKAEDASAIQLRRGACRRAEIHLHSDHEGG